MMLSRSIHDVRLVIAALAVLAASLPVESRAHAPAGSPVGAATASHSRSVLGDSLVRCSSLQQPARSDPQGLSHHVVHVFAPTSQAVFFAHAGDRCVWRAGAAVRG